MFHKKVILAIFLALVIFLIYNFLAVDLIFAQSRDEGSTQEHSEEKKSDTQTTTLTNPLCTEAQEKAGECDIPHLIGRIIKAILGVVGSIA